jgi:endonuclease/exonuclease/phosphatase (EEP) superfamily protein YafD
VHTLAIALAKPIAHSLAIIGVLWWECTAPASVGARARFALQGRIFQSPHTGKKATHYSSQLCTLFPRLIFMNSRARKAGQRRFENACNWVLAAQQKAHIIEEGVDGERGLLHSYSTHRKGFIYIHHVAFCGVAWHLMPSVDLGRCLPFPHGDLINIQWTANNVIMEYLSIISTVSCQVASKVLLWISNLFTVKVDG